LPEERRRELLAAAVRVFERVPYAQVDIALLAREAGMSSGLLYHYYPSKQALFDAAFEHLARSVVAACYASAQGAGYRFVASCLEAYLDYAAQHPHAVQLILQPSPASGSGAELNGRLNRELSVLLAEVLELGADDVERRVALRGWIAFVDAGVLALASGEKLDRARFSQRAMRVLKSALR
jgi:AcrR family transcriptional regulator